MIKVLLIDADGVVIKAPGFGSEYALKKAGIDPGFAKEFFVGPFLDCERGKKDLKEELIPYLKKWGWSSPVEEFMQQWFDYENVVDENLLMYIQELRKRGLLCYLATSQEKYRFGYIKENMKFEGKFDDFFVSYELGSLKPEVKYFEKVCMQLSTSHEITKDEIVLWDNDARCVEEARLSGFKAKVYTDFEHFKQICDAYV